MKTLHLRKSIGRSPLRLGFLLIPLALTWLALSPTSRAEDGDLGNGNTAEGAGALALGTFFGATNNTATGTFALNANQSGSHNTATGFYALATNTTGRYNTATGEGALQHNNADFNTADGVAALFNNTTGIENTANGVNALLNNRSGNNNTATGVNALINNNGSSNVADGFQALNNNNGSGNIALGAAAGFNLTTGNNNIDIGNVGVVGEGAKIRIGTVGTQNGTFIAGIRGVTVAGGVGVIVGTNGRLGTTASSARFKEAIKPMDKASEAILALKPVTFRYKHELDPEGIAQFGLVAEQVEKVNPDLVARDADGKVNTVRYDAVNAMLLNEFLKEHRKVEEQEKTIVELKSGMTALAATVKEQAAQIQKVSARIEMDKPAPQVVNNNQ